MSDTDNALIVGEMTRFLWSRHVLPVTEQEARIISQIKRRVLRDLNGLIHLLLLTALVQPPALLALGLAAEAKVLSYGQFVALLILILFAPAAVMTFVHVQSVVEAAKWRNLGLRGVRNRKPVRVISTGELVYSLVRPVRYYKLALAAICLAVGHVSWSNIPFLTKQMQSTLGFIILECALALLLLSRLWASSIDRRSHQR